MNQYIIELELLHKAEINKKNRIIEELSNELNQLKNKETNSNDTNSSTNNTLTTQNDIINDLKKIVC